MAGEKREAPGYMTYREAAIMFSLMPEKDAAKAIKATVNYYLYGTVPDSLCGSSAQVFNIMKADIDRNNAKYQKIVERNKKNIDKRWGKDSSGIPMEYQPNTNPKHETLNTKPKAKNSNAASPQRTRDFEQFWAAYPRKVGKKAAEKAFNGVDIPVETLVSAIKRQECSDQWTRDNGKYIPNPATWLNQGRWEDELAEKQVSCSFDSRSRVKTGADYQGEEDFFHAG